MPTHHEALLSLDEIRSSPDLETLVARYRAKGVAGDERTLIERARTDWHHHARLAAEAAGPPPDHDEVVAHRGPQIYRIFGVIHGIAGGDSKAYMRFIEGGVARAPKVVIENGIGYYYRHPNSEWIPDFAVLGIVRSLYLGFSVAVRLPIVFWELARELVLQRARRGGVDASLYDPSYHAMDPEVRRGLDPSPPLPSHLEVEWVLDRVGRWSLRGITSDPSACVPRSLFMAGYAVGVSERDAIDDIGLLVGDLHTMEVRHFLQEEKYAATPTFQWGRRFASLPPLQRRIRFALAKVVHLTSGVLGALVVLGPLFVLALLLYDRWS